MKTKLISVILILISVWGKAQVITTFAGIADSVGYTGDGGPAGECTFRGVYGLAVDKKQNVYICDQYNNVVRIVYPSGVINTFAGSGVAGYGGDGGPATLAQLNLPDELTIDSNNNLYIIDLENNRIRKVDTTGVISTVAGTGTAGFAGDGGPATAATLNLAIAELVAITTDLKGNIYFSDDSDGTFYIRKVNASGFISVIAGPVSMALSDTSGPATSVVTGQIGGLAADKYGNLYISDQSNVVLKLDTNGVINKFVGTFCEYCFLHPSKYYGGDGGPATAALLNGPYGLIFDRYNNLYICDVGNLIIRKVDTNGMITTYAGTDTIGGYSGDGGPATAAKFGEPTYEAVDSNGNLYIADVFFNIIRKVDKDGTAAINSITSSLKEIEVLPNPTKDVLHINGIQTVSRFRLLSLMGTESQNGILDIGNNSINLNSLPPGMYFLKITGSDDSETVTKIVKL